MRRLPNNQMEFNIGLGVKAHSLDVVADIIGTMRMQKIIEITENVQPNEKERIEQLDKELHIQPEKSGFFNSAGCGLCACLNRVLNVGLLLSTANPANSPTCKFKNSDGLITSRSCIVSDLPKVFPNFLVLRPSLDVIYTLSAFPNCLERISAVLLLATLP